MGIFLKSDFEDETDSEEEIDELLAVFDESEYFELPDYVENEVINDTNDSREIVDNEWFSVEKKI